MRRIISVSLLLLMTLAACKKSESASVAPSQPHEVKTDAAPQPPPPPARDENGAPAVAAEGGVAQAAPQTAGAFPRVDRMIIRTATLALVVRDTEKSIAAITSAIESSGGYVSASNVWRESDVLHGKLTIKVPNVRLTGALAAIRATGIRVQSEMMSSDEVTQEYVDLASQVRNLEATEAELRQLLVAVREKAKRAADILEVHQQLMIIRGQIEVAKGRMRYLEQMTSFATINVELVPDAVAAPAIEPGWQPLGVVKDATRALTNVGKELVSAAIWFLIYVLPIVIFFMLLAVIAWKFMTMLVRSSRRRLQS